MTSTHSPTTGPSMRAYRVLSPGHAEIVEIPVPRPEPGEVLVKVAAAGVCHSDVMIRNAPPVLGMPLPVTLGHEVIGDVVECGAGVDKWSPGDRVAAYVIRGCGSCASCRQGEDNLCLSGAPGRNPYRGLGTHFDGGMADFVALRADALADATGLDPVTAAPLTDAGLTALHAVNSLAPGPSAHARVLVVGVGGLGHLALQILAYRTDAQIIAVDRDPDSVELALKLGAHHAVLADGTETPAILDLAGGRNVSAVLDFVGVDATLHTAAAVTNRGSQIVVAGLGGGTIPFEATSVSTVLPEVTLRRVSAGTRRELTQILELGRAGAVRSETTTYPLEQAGDAIAAIHAGSITGRAVLVP
jgi:propanol-preferring alcohol dehydrogenase